MSYIIEKEKKNECIKFKGDDLLQPCMQQLLHIG